MPQVSVKVNTKLNKIVLHKYKTYLKECFN
jgi:hypothetical protein